MKKIENVLIILNSYTSQLKDTAGKLLPINERKKIQLCSHFCLYDAEHENLVGGGLRNSSNSVFTKVYIEVLRSNRAKAPVHTILQLKYV
jgi:hypothetical protein